MVVSTGPWSCPLVQGLLLVSLLPHQLTFHNIKVILKLDRQISCGFLLTLGVVEGVHVSVDVTLQVRVEPRRGREEGQTDGHQLPAPLQTVVAEVLGGLTTQLYVELVTETLVTPPSHHHLTWTEGKKETVCVNTRNTAVVVVEVVVVAVVTVQLSAPPPPTLSCLSLFYL